MAKKEDNTKTKNKINNVPETTNKTKTENNSKKEMEKENTKQNSKNDSKKTENNKVEPKDETTKASKEIKEEKNATQKGKEKTKKEKNKKTKAQPKEKNNQKKETQSKEKANKKTETQLQEKTTKEIEEVVAKEIKANKKLPSAELGKINSRVFQNICLAVVVMFYLNFVILGFINIENSVFITDLKVFSMAILIISIGIFEYAYKKDSGRHTIHGIEILMLSFITMLLVYIDIMWTNKFIYIVAFVTYIFAIYYVAKSIIIYKRMKKEYFLGEMKEMIKK